MSGKTTAVKKLGKLQKPKKVIQGGTWAGKTQGIIINLIYQCIQTPKDDITVVAETVPAVKFGALKIFKEVMEFTGNWYDEHYNATDRIYKFYNGSVIQFSAFDTIGKAKAAGKRKKLFLNECNYIPFLIAYELIVRTSGDVWFDYNPNNPFWIQQEILGDEDVDFMILTYKDNETTPENKIREFDRNRERAKTSKYWANWCKVYLDGELGSLEGVVLQDWAIVDQAPSDGLIGYGMDFGYTNDPTTLIACYVVDGVRIFDELIYQRGLTTPDLARRMNDLTDSYTYTFADSADPKTIDELWQYGIKIQGATKGADSVNRGISILQEEHFKVTARSTNLIKELREYCWDTDKEGNTTNKPVGIYNHCIDAMRYLAIERLSKANIPRARPMITLPKFH